MIGSFAPLLLVVRILLGVVRTLFGLVRTCLSSPFSGGYGHDNTLVEFQVSGFLEQEESGTLRVG